MSTVLFSNVNFPKGGYAHSGDCNVDEATSREHDRSDGKQIAKQIPGARDLDCPGCIVEIP